MKKGGMPKGHKTKKTLIKEEVQKHGRDMFIDFMVKGTQDVLNVVHEKAVGGDMTACKLWLDRVLPTTKAVDSNNVHGDMIINVSVSKLERPEDITVINQGDDNGST